MARFRKKPIEIEARQLHPNGDGCNCHALIAWIGKSAFIVGAGVEIDTPEGTMEAVPGDWIIKGIAGEFYPCKPEIFTATYDPVDGE